ncbi:MAG TPA: cyclic nucleotide-binding domain-containing protein [Acidobacteriota bacterium]|nr:cyclic nucleotide-binding domain-containing protein [Acidobacteriota bacterium]
MAPVKRKEQEDPQDLMARKEYRKAIAIFRDRLGKQPKNGMLRLNLADALLVDSRPEEAVAEYKVLAAQYAKEGFMVRAIALYKKILKLKPNLSEIEKLLNELSDQRSKIPSRRSSPKIDEDEPIAKNADAEKPAMYGMRVETKLFSNFSPDEFKRVVSSLALHHYEEDTIVVKEGDPGNSLFVVVMGEVRVLTKDKKNREVVLANLGEGEFFGEISLLTSKPRTATIITNTDSELLELTRKDYEKISADHPNVKKVMHEFHEARAYETVEAMIQALHKQS